MQPYYKPNLFKNYKTIIYSKWLLTPLNIYMCAKKRFVDKLKSENELNEVIFTFINNIK